MTDPEQSFEALTDVDYATALALEEVDRVLALETFYSLLDGMKGGGVVRHIIDEARGEAVGAMLQLVTVPSEQTTAVRDLQWQVTRYEALCRWLRAIVENGKAAESDLTEEARIDLEKAIRGEVEAKD